MAPQNANPTIPRPHNSVKVQVTEYDSETGLPLRSLSSINFGSSQINNFSSPIVIKMNVTGVRKAGNIKLCILSASQDAENFGIEHSPQFSQKDSLSSFFPGFNPTGDPSSPNNISIKNVSDTQSEFIYLNVKSPTTLHRGSVYFKWIFEFS